MKSSVLLAVKQLVSLFTFMVRKYCFSAARMQHRERGRSTNEAGVSFPDINGLSIPFSVSSASLALISLQVEIV